MKVITFKQSLIRIERDQAVRRLRYRRLDNLATAAYWLSKSFKL